MIEEAEVGIVFRAHIEPLDDLAGDLDAVIEIGRPAGKTVRQIPGKYRIEGKQPFGRAIAADEAQFRLRARLQDMAVEAGKFELNTEDFALKPLLESCRDMLRLKANSGGVDLVCGPLDGLGEIVADRRAVKQIVANLLSNAVKFTPKGGTARISAVREGGEFIFVVEDNGVGIDPEVLARIGEPFFQAHADYDRHFEGAGLGLSLVRGLVGLHGGSMRIESAPGVGTRVTVRMPSGVCTSR